MSSESLRFTHVPYSEFPKIEWNSVFQKSKTHNLFYHPALVEVAGAVWPERCPHGVIIGRSKGAVMAILPYRIVDTGMGRIVETASVPTADRNAPVLAPDAGPEVVSGLLDYIEHCLKPDLLITSSIDEALFEQIRNEFNGSSGIRTVDKQDGYIRYLSDSMDDFWQQFNSKDRNQIKRKIRKGEEAGLTFRVVDNHRLPPGYNLTSALENLSAVHKLRFETKNKPSFFLQPDFQEFHQRLCELDAEDGLSFTFTEALHDGKVVGSMYGVKSDVHYIFLMIGFDPDYSHLSPGNLLIFHTIEDLIHQGIKTIDFKCGNEAYKKKWTKDYYTKYKVFVTFSLRGRLLSSGKYISSFFNKLKRVPAKLNRSVFARFSA